LIKIVLHQDQIHVSDRDVEISTILGSCVALCLYDRVNKIGGMNHYLLPLWNGAGLKSARYGNIANELLLKKVLVKGAEKRHLVAKIFGGSMINIDSSVSVANRNVKMAKNFCLKNNIAIVAEDTSGTKGRKVLFSIETGDVYVRYSGK
jgi:chemotaxis protein CheD